MFSSIYDLFFSKSSRSHAVEKISADVETDYFKSLSHRKNVYSGARALLDACSDSFSMIHMMSNCRMRGMVFIASTEFKTAMIEMALSPAEDRFSHEWYAGPDTFGYVGPDTFEYSKNLKYHFRTGDPVIDSVAQEFLNTFKENSKLTQLLTDGPARGQGIVVFASDELLDAMIPHLDTELLRQFHASVIVSSNFNRRKLLASLGNVV